MWGLKIVLTFVVISLLEVSEGNVQRKQELVKSLVNTCFACNYVKALVDNNPPIEDITQYLREQCQIYGKKGPPKEFCANIDDHVKDAYELAKLYSKIGCNDFCGPNEKVLSTDIACDLGQYVIEHMDLYMDQYLPKIAKMICKDKKTCAKEMLASKELIKGVLNRLILRGARVIDQKNYCGIQLDKVQMGHRVLDQSNNNSLGTELLCDLCDRLAIWLNNTILNIESPSAPPFWIAISKALVPICKLLPESVQQSFQNCDWKSIVSLFQTILPALQVCLSDTICQIIIPDCPHNSVAVCNQLFSALPMKAEKWKVQ